MISSEFDPLMSTVRDPGDDVTLIGEAFATPGLLDTDDADEPHLDRLALGAWPIRT